MRAQKRAETALVLNLNKWAHGCGFFGPWQLRGCGGGGDVWSCAEDEATPMRVTVVLSGMGGHRMCARGALGWGDVA